MKLLIPVLCLLTAYVTIDLASGLDKFAISTVGQNTIATAVQRLNGLTERVIPVLKSDNASTVSFLDSLIKIAIDNVTASVEDFETTIKTETLSTQAEEGFLAVTRMLKETLKDAEDAELSVFNTKQRFIFSLTALFTVLIATTTVAASGASIACKFVTCNPSFVELNLLKKLSDPEVKIGTASKDLVSKAVTNLRGLSTTLAPIVATTPSYDFLDKLSKKAIDALSSSAEDLQLAMKLEKKPSEKLQGIYLSAIRTLKSAATDLETTNVATYMRVRSGEDEKTSILPLLSVLFEPLGDATGVLSVICVVADCN